LKAQDDNVVSSLNERHLNDSYLKGIMRKNQSAELRKPEILESYYQVLIEEGLEGASIGKIADRLNIHPSLIIHYFKTKERMKLALVDLLVEKYNAPEFLSLAHIADNQDRFEALMDTLFSFEWSRTVDPGVHFGFYYLSFRSEAIQERFKEMFKALREHLKEQMAYFSSKGIIKVHDPEKAADIIVTLMEGLEFHSQFLSTGKPFQAFAQTAKETAILALKSGQL
jgi:AcrR family transcriptional regulator